MSEDELFQQIVQHALAAYGSFEEPNHSFRSTIDCERPYRKLVDEMATHFFLHDATEWNYDVSFRYVVKDSADDQWMVQLSMVDRYGALFSLGATHPTLLEPWAENGVRSEAIIRQLLRNHKVMLLGEKTLTTPIPIKLFNAEPENAAVYQTLFSDTDVLPWRAVIR